MVTSDVLHSGPVGAGDGQDEDAPPRRRRHRARWVLAALVLMVGGTVAYFELSSSPARQVSLQQAKSRLGPVQPAGTYGPAPGVYSYRGSGTDHLSLMSLSQAEGPQIPGTVTPLGAGCWRFRLDFSTHHWQTWEYCQHGSDIWLTGGQVWQLWPIGPINFTNLTTTTCNEATVALPAQPALNQTWSSTCSGTSNQVKGAMQTSGVLRYLGPATLSIGGKSVTAEHLQLNRTDTGAQTGDESYEMWLQKGTGLPLRLTHSIRVSTSTPIGKTTYTESGTLSLESLQPVG